MRKKKRRSQCKETLNLHRWTLSVTFNFWRCILNVCYTNRHISLEQLIGRQKLPAYLLDLILMEVTVGICHTGKINSYHLFPYSYRRTQSVAQVLLAGKFRAPTFGTYTDGIHSVGIVVNTSDGRFLSYNILSDHNQFSCRGIYPDGCVTGSVFHQYNLFFLQWSWREK